MDINPNNIIETTGANAAEILDEADYFVANDPYGLLMAALGMSIVFLVLLLLFIVFTNTPRIYTFDFKSWWANLIASRKAKLEMQQSKSISENKASDLSGEVNAAIAAAIHLYRSEMHDYENTVLTISKVSRVYSPWSSKIYGLRNSQR